MSGPAGRRWRALGMGLATVLGVARQGFFIPARWASAAPERPAPYAAVERLFAAFAEDFAAILAELDRHAEAFAAIAADAPAPQPRWRQDWFPRLDAAVAFALVRKGRPRRIVEIGSGHSTRFLAAAATGAGTRITAIDPAPRAPLPEGVEHLAAPLQTVGEGPFADLRAGDVVFVDSSHVLMPGSDVDAIVNRVLPALRPGVRVHVHDVFLPDPYPSAWRWRGYNEQLALAPLLVAGRLRPLFASHYVTTRLADRVAASVAARLPSVPGARETSLWAETR